MRRTRTIRLAGRLVTASEEECYRMEERAAIHGFVGNADRNTAERRALAEREKVDWA